VPVECDWCLNEAVNALRDASLTERLGKLRSRQVEKPGKLHRESRSRSSLDHRMPRGMRRFSKISQETVVDP
jgi:hypothetical protein